MKVGGKVVVVTGGGQGIGAALCTRFASDGAHVIVLDINVEAGSAVAEAIGGRFIRCDVGNRAQLDTAIETIEAERGPIDLFCSNAAIFGGDGSTGLAETSTLR